MSNPAEGDNGHVAINIEGDKISEAEAEAKPADSVTPMVPQAANRSEKEAKPPRAGSNTRSRQLKPGATGNRSRSNSRSPNRRVRRDTEAAQNDAIPLLPTDESRLPRPEPPLAGPEMDDDGPDEGRGNYDPYINTGIDDGFLPDKSDRSGSDRPNGRRTPGRRDSYPMGPFPTPAGYGPSGPPIPESRVIPDMNVYQQKKSLAQGMMDLALLSANANQLRYVLESYQRHPYFYFSLVFISTSIICQVAVGIGLIWKSRYNIKNEDDFCKADRINNLVTIGIFVITLVNVLISAFGVADPPRST
ncbi:ninjurin-A-like [Toxorhynchites rutilus septentrionalis]|uniref:ninjurin-A-like n=1 Tax=Toxorhynchites rutilus septentrionalis TaxID=329112 RepID=UPI00247B2A4E|nr:ninjurin-A-like [Toxorhynchites rutilus septentrionalis]